MLGVGQRSWVIRRVPLGDGEVIQRICDLRFFMRDGQLVGGLCMQKGLCGTALLAKRPTQSHADLDLHNRIRMTFQQPQCFEAVPGGPAPRVKTIDFEQLSQVRNAVHAFDAVQCRVELFCARWRSIGICEHINRACDKKQQDD